MYVFLSFASTSAIVSDEFSFSLINSSVPVVSIELMFQRSCTRRSFFLTFSFSLDF